MDMELKLNQNKNPVTDKLVMSLDTSVCNKAIGKLS